mgnify:CR=1 FL=1
MKSRRRVLFLCTGNSARSQMAEAFATRYGSDVLVARSEQPAGEHAVSKLSSFCGIGEEAISAFEWAIKLMNTYNDELPDNA